ncbi:MAG: Hint domain-containing protein [Pseudomonadota bacterium]
MTMMTRIARATGAAGPLLGLSGMAALRTPCGERRVENVRPGDLIVTRDNGLQPVRLVWTRTVTEADIAADPSLAPVRLKQRAIGPMMPRRDLVVAPRHRILVPGYRLADRPDCEPCLIAARDIAEASDDAFLDKGVGEITYYNIVFDAHQVFCANGLPVESYLPCADTLGELGDEVRESLAAIFFTGPEVGEVFPAPRYSAPEQENYRPEFV